jgi:hypothetical protein
VRTFSRSPPPSEVIAMSRFLAPLSFTIAAAWVLVVFVLAHNNA